MNFIEKGELKMKFKVGQKVKVKDFYDIAGTIDRAHCTHGLPFTRTMLELCGKTFTITNIRNIFLLF